MKKRYSFFDNEGVHEYVGFVIETPGGTKYQLFRSEGEQWTVSGELLLECLDNGDDVIFSKKIGQKMDYSQFVEMRLLLNMVNQYDKNLGSYKMVEFIKMVDV